MSQAPQASLSSSMQINLTGAQRLGILAAVALSSSLVFLFYTNKKPRLVCGDAIESPRSRFLNFLSFGSEPSAAAAACAPVAEDCTAARPTRLDASTTPQPEGTPSCPHNPGPLGPNMCLQCAETKFINILERSRLSEWSWACPNALSPATATGRPSSPSPGAEEPGVMESLLPAVLSPSSYASLSYGSPTSDSAAHASGTFTMAQHCIAIFWCTMVMAHWGNHNFSPIKHPGASKHSNAARVSCDAYPWHQCHLLMDRDGSMARKSNQPLHWESSSLCLVINGQVTAANLVSGIGCPCTFCLDLLQQLNSIALSDI